MCSFAWLCFSCRFVTDKILAILFPITAFVVLGFEHCVANMYFIFTGLVVKQDPVLFAASSGLSNGAHGQIQARVFFGSMQYILEGAYERQQQFQRWRRDDALNV